MRAIDLVKSLSLSSITSEDFMVVTLYKGQDPGVFLVDNFGDGKITSPMSPKPLTILESQDYLAVYNNVPLVTPDGKSEFVPDYVYQVSECGCDCIVSLYNFN